MDKEKIKEVQDWLDKHPIQIEYDDGLSSEHIAMILEGEIDDVYLDLSEWNSNYIFESAEIVLKSVIEMFGLDITADELWEEVAVTHVVNIDYIIKHTVAHIAVNLHIDHYHDHDYDYLSEELEQLGVNPKDMDPSWPDIPSRDPLISPEDLRKVWHNGTHDYGEWYALLDGRDTLMLYANHPKVVDDGSLILKAGATVTTHNYWQGSSSLLAQTLRDIKVFPSDVFHDGVIKYGIKRTYGNNISGNAWNGLLERHEVDD
jgi:hypothetical protein